MKQYTIKSILAVLVLAAFAVTGCLKDKDYNSLQIQSTQPDGTNHQVVEIKLTAGDASNVELTSFDAINRDTTLNFIPVNLATSYAATEDVNVTLALKPSLVSDYNTANGTSLVVPAASMYTILNPGLVVTIPKGSHTAYLQIKLKPADFIGSDWGLGFTIVSIDKPGYTISGNLSNGLVGFGIKNKYDGQYSLLINTVGWNAYGIADGISGLWPSNIAMVTAGANSVTIFDYLRGDNLQPAFTGGFGAITGSTAFGAASPQFTFDGSDKLISVTNTTPDDGRGRTFHLNTAVSDSRYDGATKTIYAAYIMTQAGRVDQQIYDTLRYLIPR